MGFTSLGRFRVVGADDGQIFRVQGFALQQQLSRLASSLRCSLRIAIAHLGNADEEFDELRAVDRKELDLSLARDGPAAIPAAFSSVDVGQ